MCTAKCAKKKSLRLITQYKKSGRKEREGETKPYGKNRQWKANHYTKPNRIDYHTNCHASPQLTDKIVIDKTIKICISM